MKKFYRIKNGKKGGRPDAEKQINTFIIPNYNTVILTETQYNNLIERYGMSLLSRALELLDGWLNTKPVGVTYRGKNNYAFFRSDGWVINMAKNICK